MLEFFVALSASCLICASAGASSQLLAGLCRPSRAIKRRQIDATGHKNAAPSGVSALARRKTPRHHALR